MSIEKVRQYFQPLGREQDILEFETSSATVELAAQAAGRHPRPDRQDPLLPGGRGLCADRDRRGRQNRQFQVQSHVPRQGKDAQS